MFWKEWETSLTRERKFKSLVREINRLNLNGQVNESNYLLPWEPAGSKFWLTLLPTHVLVICETTLCISPTKPSGTAAWLGRLGFSKCGCPLVAAAFPIPNCNRFSFTLVQLQKAQAADWSPLPVLPFSERETLTLSCISLPKYLSPETLLTVKEIYHSLFAFCFPD